jgi:beta-galactosidase
MCFIALASVAKAAPTPDDGKQHKFSLHDDSFWIDDQPLRLFSGEIHPGRIPPDQWDDRIKKAKAMGLNTISVYVFWNQIEVQPGQFVFKDFTDIRKFAQLCQANGMWMIVRSGPYCCAEWEFGGFPAWLVKNKTIKLRSEDPDFIAHCKTYIEQIHGQLGDLQVTHGGPILIMQIENELHLINPYLAKIKDIFVNAGFDTQLSTCDPGAVNATPWNIDNGLPGVLRGYNGFKDKSTDGRYDRLKVINKATGYPPLSPEVYTGWFNTFGPVARKPVVPVATQVASTEWMLSHPDLSWTYYVFDGGTNFGYFGGANNSTPMQTSYDYDAPIDELGRVTPKYKALRDLMIKTLKLDLPPIPADPKIIEVPEFTQTATRSILSALPATPIQSTDVQSFEDIGQNYGFVDYRHTFPAGAHGDFKLAANSHDYAFILVNGKCVSDVFGFQRFNPSATTVKLNEDGPVALDIIVHNLGRNSLMSANSSGASFRKGLLANPTLDNKPLTDWAIYSMPLDEPPAAQATDKTPSPESLAAAPAFYEGTFNLPETGETYLDLSNYHFGVVWVNGHNLGRYWDVGDCRAMYLPSSWQKQGENQITVLELGTPPAKPSIKGVKDMIKTPQTQFKPFWVQAAAAR